MGKRRDRSQAWKGRRRTVSIADDDRGRVPFALVGVLLLVSASTYAAGLTDQGLVSENRSVERAVDRVDADATAALRHAAREAAYTAAARPVVRPVRTSVRQSGAGTAAVRPGTAFEDAFRIRAALAGHRALTAVNASVGGVTATARFDRLESPLTPDDVVTLREQVDVGSTADGTATRVVFENVTIRATRDGRTVAEQTRDRAVVVAVPTLAAHERTERFERRLNAGPVEGPGLGRQLTASLYPITWARGYGQYGKVPIQNVLSNRHVELSTNAGIVRVQRDVFGTSDPDARGGVAAATARTGITDLLAPTPLDEAAWSDAVIGAPTPSPASAGSRLRGPTPTRHGASLSDTQPTPPRSRSTIRSRRSLVGAIASRPRSWSTPTGSATAVVRGHHTLPPHKTGGRASTWTSKRRLASVRPAPCRMRCRPGSSDPASGSISVR